MANYVLSESLKFDNVLLMAENQMYRSFRDIDRENIKESFKNDELFSEEAYSYLVEAEENNTTKSSENKKKESLGEFIKRVWTAIVSFFQNLGLRIAKFLEGLAQWLIRTIAKAKTKKEDVFVTPKYKLDLLKNAVNQTTINLKNLVSGHYSLDRIETIAKGSKINFDPDQNKSSKERAYPYLVTCSGLLKTINSNNKLLMKNMKEEQNKLKEEQNKLKNADNSETIANNVKAINEKVKGIKKLIMEDDYKAGTIIRKAAYDVAVQALGNDVEKVLDANSEEIKVNDNSKHIEPEWKERGQTTPSNKPAAAGGWTGYSTGTFGH